MFDVAWCFAFFGGAACSGAMIVVLSGASAGAASPTFDGSAAAGNAVSAEVDTLAGVDAGTALAVSAMAAAGAAAIELTAGATAGVGGTVFGAAAFADTEAAGEGADTGIATFAAGRRAGGFCGAARDEARAELPGLSLCGATATEAGGDAGCAGATTAGAVCAGAAGTTDGTAAARTLVTIAREAIGVFSGSLGRSIRERTTPAPAVAPIAVATKTTRAVRAKLDAGAK